MTTKNNDDPVRIARGSRVVTVRRHADLSVDVTIDIKGHGSTAVLRDAERVQLIEALGGRA